MIYLFSAASFLGAFLLFLVQPMVAKIALPTLGGAPYVWNGCMVFFQAALLGGYVYAHIATSKLSRRNLPIVHLLFMFAVMLIALPLHFTLSDNINPITHPMGWLFMLLITTVGLPFFVVSATAPMVQHWFARTAHKDAHNPYFLYAASNIGSFIALLGYPFIIEPLMPVVQQAWLFSLGYVVLIALFGGMAWFMRNASMTEVRTQAFEVAKTALKPLPRERAFWVLLAFIPSSLLYGVTTFVTTDIASVPLLWVLPLALYLLTFILVFANRPHGIALAKKLHVPAVLLLLILPLLPLALGTGLMLLHLLVFFIVAMACHGILSERRPHAAHLTEFYLLMSLGGVLGGLFNALLAPMIFNNVMEYPLILALSLPVAGTLYVKTMPPLREKLILALAGFSAVFVLPLLNVQGREQAAEVKFTERNFFGVNRVAYNPKLEAMQFWHGTTNHGVQSTREEDRLAPVAYYTLLKQVFALAPAKTKPVAVLGLGVGTVACYGARGQAFDMYEIDPAVERIARDENYFTYMRDCAPTKQVVLGDARLKLADAEDQRFGIMVMDAFTSDAIPVHLLTKEALALYASKLAPRGVMAFNISNRHINLKRVLSAVAAENGLVGITRLDLLQAQPNDEVANDRMLAAVRKCIHAERKAMADERKEILPPNRGRLGGGHKKVVSGKSLVDSSFIASNDSAAPHICLPSLGKGKCLVDGDAFIPHMPAVIPRHCEEVTPSSGKAQHAKDETGEGFKANASPTVTNCSGEERLRFASEWVVLARDWGDLLPLLEQEKGWYPLPKPQARYLWTDQFSNIVMSLKALE